MSRIKALSLATAAILAPQLVRAADMLPPPPMVAPLRGAIVEDFEASGWYIRGDAGASINTLTMNASKFFSPTVTVPDPQFDQTSIGNSGFVQFGVGYQFNNWLRADVTGIIRTNSAYQAVESYNQGAFFTPPTNARGMDNYSANINSYALLANGYLDLGTWNGLTPYIGAGAGVAIHNVSGLHDISGINPAQGGGFNLPGYGYAASRVSMAPAFALMTGVTWDVNRRLKLEMGYRYLALGTASGGIIKCQPDVPATGCPFEEQSFKLASHDFHIGMRWMLGEVGGSSSYGGGSVLPSAGYSNGGHAGGGYSTGGYSAGGQVVSGGYGNGAVVSGGAGGYAAGPVVSTKSHY